MASTATWIPHMRLSWGGTLGTPSIEQWSNTVKWFQLGPPPAIDTLQAACNAAVGPLSTWMASADASLNQHAKLDWVKLNWVLANGLQRDPVTVLTELPTPVAGGSAAATPPFYQTYAITLRSRSRRGRAHAGRIYPPLVQHITDGSGSPYQSELQALAQATKFIQTLVALRAAMGTVIAAAVPGTDVPDPGIFSAGDSLTGVPPLWQPIIAAVVDRVPDVQHRRTNRVPRSEGTTVLLDP